MNRRGKRPYPVAFELIAARNTDGLHTVNDAGCWIWNGRRHECGYGLVDQRREGDARNRPQRAHRLYFEAYVGPIPEGLHVLHLCDTPACVNPDHMALGTHRANMHDARRKQRFAHGERHGAARLSEVDARSILRMHASGRFSIGELAEAFGVSWATVQRLVKGESWRHIDRPGEAA